MPLIPSKLWQVGYIGTSPDGLTRVCSDRNHLVHKGGIKGDVYRRAWGLSRCKVYATRSEYRVLVILKDGRAGYTGDVAFWRGAIAQLIASGVRSLSMSSEGYVRGLGDWKFE